MRKSYLLLLIGFSPLWLQAQYPGWDKFIYANSIQQAAETSTDIWLSVHGGIVQIDVQSGEQTFHDMAWNGFESKIILDFWVDENDRLYYLASPNTLGYWDGEAWIQMPYLSLVNLTDFHQIAGKSGDTIILLGYDDVLYCAYPDGAVSPIGSVPNHLGGFIDGAFAKDNGQTVLWSRQEIGMWAEEEYVALYTTATDLFQHAFPGEGDEIWLQANKGLYHFADSDWTFLAYDQIDESGFYVHDFCPGSAGKGFLITEAGPYEITVENSEFSWRELDHDLSENVLWWKRMYVDQQQQFWFFDYDQPNLWVWQEGRAAQKTSFHPWLPIHDSQCIAIDPEGRIWIGGWGGLAYLHGGSWHFLAQSSSFNSSGINEILFTQTGEPILATGSLFTFNIPPGEIIRWDQQLSAWDTLDRTESLLEGQVITRLVQDQKGSLWMIDGSQSVLSIYSRDRWFDFLITNRPFFASWFTAIAEAPDGTMWIATNNGLFSYDGFQFRAEADPTTLDLSTNLILDLEFDEKGQLWLAAGEGGIRCWDGQEWIAYRVGEELPEESSSYQIMPGLPGEIWVSLYGDGVARFDGSEWTHFTEENSGLHSNYVNDLACDAYGRMWFSSGSGLSSYLPGHTAIKPFQLNTDQTIAVYPNPGCCHFQASWRNEEATNADLVIYDVMGREVRRIPTGDHSAGEHFIQFERGNLLPGLYYLNLAGDKKGQAAPFVVR